jgi:hypothetical protein
MFKEMFALLMGAAHHLHPILNVAHLVPGHVVQGLVAARVEPCTLAAMPPPPPTAASGTLTRSQGSFMKLYRNMSRRCVCHRKPLTKLS